MWPRSCLQTEPPTIGFFEDSSLQSYSGNKVKQMQTAWCWRELFCHPQGTKILARPTSLLKERSHSETTT